MRNAGMVAEGNFVFEKLVLSGLAPMLENMVTCLKEGRWGIDDLAEITVKENNGKSSKVSVMTPHHNQGGPVDTDRYFYAIDRETHELIVQTNKGWQRTDYIMRLV